MRALMEGSSFVYSQVLHSSQRASRTCPKSTRVGACLARSVQVGAPRSAHQSAICWVVWAPDVSLCATRFKVIKRSTVGIGNPS